MSESKPVQAAEEVARGIFGPLVGSNGVPSFADFDSGMKSFAAVAFEVPAGAEADGFLFQYGLAGWLPTPMFVLGVTRQLEMTDGQGEHESYLQLNFEFRYSPDDVGASPDSADEWWFAGEGRSFSEWYDAVREKSIWHSLATVSPIEFSIAQDIV